MGEVVRLRRELSGLEERLGELRRGEAGRDDRVVGRLRQTRLKTLRQRAQGPRT
ncbi:MAG: hypothetical protein ACE5IB_01210 [Candidatus Geothermarchaeales archaeon]